MGLDMYLKADVYLSGWKHSPERDRKQYAAALELVGLEAFACKESPSVTVSVTVAYWRKANAIHRWFVEHVQKGVDVCQRAYVSRDQLRELIAACKQVLGTVETVEGDVSMGTAWTRGGGPKELTKPGTVVAQKGVAAAILPTQSGFFFGNTDYDDGYLADLRDTVAQVEPLLTLPEEVDLYYRSSW